MTAKDEIIKEYSLTAFNPEKAITITLSKLESMMEKYAANVLRNERSKQ